MKLKFRLLCIAIFLGSFLQQVLAQNFGISGKVLNASSKAAIESATVTIKGSTSATTTDNNGNFSLTVPKGATLLITSAGFIPSSYKVNSTGTIEVLLEGADKKLDEVIVIGYGVQKITKISGAVSTIKNADIQKVNAVRAEDAIQGRAAGVNVIQGGSPGSSPTVLIRGIPSFTGTDPTVIIDGVPQTLTDFNSISAADIESISILKDAATTAIYGVKGGSGVIVVTTKTGRKNQKTEINISSNYGIQQVMNTIGVLNATEYGAMINEGSTTSGGNTIFTDLSKLGVGTNWQDQVFKNAPLQSHTISARGGSEKVTYFLSAAYLDQAGIVGGIDKSNYSRGNFTANINFELTPKLKFLFNTSAVLLNSKGVQENSFNSILGSALNFDPTVSINNTAPKTAGNYGFSNLLLSEVFNPLTKLDNTHNENQGSKIYGKFELQYDLIKNLKFTSRFGYTKYDGNSKAFSPLAFYGPLNVDNSMNADGSAVTGKHNQVNQDIVGNFNYTFENFANYNFNIGQKNHFETVLGMALAKISGHGSDAYRQDVPFNAYSFADFSAATGTNTATNVNAQGGSYYRYFRNNLSYFNRINYDYDERYLASFTARRDASYAFGTNNKFANFLSGSLGWVVSKEQFFHSEFINNFKIRGSYGSTGNENINPQYVSITTGGPSYGPTANSNGYTFDNVFYPGSTVSSAANNNLRWERQLQMNVGFDLNFFKNKFSLSADYFEKNVDGLLFTPSASLYLGTVPIPPANIGSTSTKGYDATLGYNDSYGKNFKINTAVTFTTSKNLVTKTNDDGTAKIFGGYYFNGQSQSVTVFEKGQTPGYFYGYKTMGLFQSESEISKAPAQQGAQAGDIRYADINKDGVINDKDKTKIGDPFPKFTMGWNLSISYKNFDFSSFVYASVGNDIYRAYERNANYTNKFRSILARWTGPNTTNDARYPRYAFTDPNNNARISDRYVEDGSFIKVKNLQLGYTFTRSDSKFLNKVRIYGQVKNAIKITKYTGYDPEIPGGILATGVDYGAYPQPRTFTVGLDIKL